MNSKKGQTYLAGKVINIVIGIACIVLLFFVGRAGASLIFGSEDKLSAQSNINELAETFEAIEIGQNETYQLLAPDGWFLVLFAEEDAKKPAECLSSCMCICPSKTFGGYNCEKGFCKTLSKAIKFDEKEKAIKIPSEVFLKNIKEYFSISLKQKIKLEKAKIETLPSEEVSKNYTIIKKEGLKSSARSEDIDRIVLHHTGGSTFSGAYSSFKTTGLSVHYVIDRDGKIYYLVDEKRRAYHALGANEDSIGIEIVNIGLPDMGYTDAQYASIKALLTDIVKRWPLIKYDNEHIIGHFEIKNEAGACRKFDPSPNFDWSKIGLPNHPTSAKECPLLVEHYGFEVTSALV